MNQNQTTEMKKTMEEIERLERELEARGVEPVAEKSTEKSSTLKRRNKSFKNSVIASIAFALISVVLFSAQTYAYFTDSETSENNTIKAGNLKMEIIPAGEMGALTTAAFMPGTEVDRSVSIKNTGSLPAYIRVKIDISITSDNSVPANWKDYVDFNITDLWDYKDGYYYYKVKVESGLITEKPVFDKITFSTDMDNSFTNSEIKITVTSEAIQSTFTGDSPLTAPWPTP